MVQPSDYGNAALADAFLGPFGKQARLPDGSEVKIILTRRTRQGTGAELIHDYRVAVPTDAQGTLANQQVIVVEDVSYYVFGEVRAVTGWSYYSANIQEAHPGYGRAFGPGYDAGFH